MNWKNLLKNKCPICKKDLWFDKSEEMICCNDLKCGFMVRQRVMNKICLGIQDKKLSYQDYETVDNFDLH